MGRSLSTHNAFASTGLRTGPRRLLRDSAPFGLTDMPRAAARMAAAMESLPWPFKGGGNGSAAAYGDLESPHALDFAAARVARSTTSADGTFHELVFLATGPDAMSVHMTRNTLASLATVGLGVHVLLLADSPETCKHFEREFVVAGGSSPGLTIPGRPCYWSSRVLHDAPADSVSLRKFWDWRFRFYYVKKAYLSRLVRPPAAAAARTRAGARLARKARGVGTDADARGQRETRAGSERPSGPRAAPRWRHAWRDDSASSASVRRALSGERWILGDPGRYGHCLVPRPIRAAASYGRISRRHGRRPYIIVQPPLLQVSRRRDRRPLRLSPTPTPANLSSS